MPFVGSDVGEYFYVQKMKRAGLNEPGHALQKQFDKLAEKRRQKLFKQMIVID